MSGIVRLFSNIHILAIIKLKVLILKSFTMEAIEFINNYETYVEEISAVIKPELLPIIDELKNIDPHDLIKPETFIMAESHARGLIWTMFLQRVKKNSSTK